MMDMNSRKNIYVIPAKERPPECFYRGRESSKSSISKPLKDTGFPLSRTAVRNKLVMPAEAGIQRLKSLDSGYKHAGMTVFKRLFEFKPECL